MEQRDAPVGPRRQSTNGCQSCCSRAQETEGPGRRLRSQKKKKKGPRASGYPRVLLRLLAAKQVGRFVEMRPVVVPYEAARPALAELVVVGSTGWVELRPRSAQLPICAVDPAASQEGVLGQDSSGA